MITVKLFVSWRQKLPVKPIRLGDLVCMRLKREQPHEACGWCCCLHQESILVQLNNLPSFGSPATCYPISSSIELGCFEFGFCFCDSNMYAHILHLLLSQFHHCVFPESCPFNLYFQVYWHCSQHLSFIFLPRLYYVLSN